jgi:hypothetical protein
MKEGREALDDVPAGLLALGPASSTSMRHRPSLAAMADLCWRGTLSAPAKPCAARRIAMTWA